MKKLPMFAAILLLGATIPSGAQQAAMPTPPKTVNPTPQPATSCRGCTDDVTTKKTVAKGYDQKTPDSTASHRSANPKTVAQKPKHATDPSTAHYKATVHKAGTKTHPTKGLHPEQHQPTGTRKPAPAAKHPTPAPKDSVRK